MFSSAHAVVITDGTFAYKNPDDVVGGKDTVRSKQLLCTNLCTIVVKGIDKMPVDGQGLALAAAVGQGLAAAGLGGRKSRFYPQLFE